MKLRILKFTLVGLVSTIIIFVACQKKYFFDKSVSTEKTQLVSLDTARYIAVHFNPISFFHADDTTNHSPIRSLLDGNNKIEDYTTIYDSKEVPALYVFNFAHDKGFIFVSADYQLRPVLAFIETGNFKKDTVPSGIIQWATKTINNIEIVRSGQYDNSKVARAAWKNYFYENQRLDLPNNDTASSVPSIQEPPPSTDPCESNPDYYTSNTTTVGPLLSVTWGQDCSYNNLCPDKMCDDCSSNSVTGCVATSMAQLIKFWHPSNSFNYNYSLMPTVYGNSEVQRLMHDAGLQVNMNYGCAATGGSSAYGSNVPGALISNFGFSSASRSNYTATSYITVKNNIANNWPVLLEGCNDRTNIFLGIWYTYQNCHEWVSDGYQQTDVTFCSNGSSVSESYLFFHMNWGWHETISNPPYNYSDYNGWFAFDNWNISGVGQNGSDLNFRYANSMVTDIHP